MKLTHAIALVASSMLVVGCASTVVPVFGDAGPSDVRPDVPIAADAPADRVDVSPTCADFQTLCSGRCVDTQSDRTNCGECGRTCAFGSCANGMCTPECAPAQLPCNGRCVDIRVDPSNCGGCGIACADSTCIMGTCQTRCPPELTACESGCVDLLRDPGNCGGCNRACPTVTSGMSFCSGGMCNVVCSPGFSACGAQCVDVSSDANNCGSCGHTCPAGGTCVASVCQVGTRPPPGAYSIPYAPLATTGTSAVNGDDVTSGLVPIGFSFRYFSNTYTQVNISSNGFIGFDAMMSQGCCSGLRIPMSDMIDNVIAAAWTDLFPPGSPLVPNAVTYETRGTAPGRVFVVSWTNVPWCCSGSMGSVTTQIVLHETTGVIDIFTTSQSPGHVYTQGAENATGTVAYFIPGRSSADYALTNDGVRIFTY